MLSFFNESFSEQVKVAVDSNDPKFLQVLLGIRHCQLKEDWFAHVILSHKIIGVIHTLKYQLPMNIISAQQQVLNQNFSKIMYCELPIQEVTIGDDNAIKANKALENVENGILKRYKEFKHEVVDSKYQVFNVRGMLDANEFFPYSHDGSDYTGENTCLKDATESLRKRIALRPVLKLDVSSQYDEMYDEMYKEIVEQYQLRIASDQSTSKLCRDNESLTIKMSKLQDGEERLRSILSSISKEVVGGIQNDKFMTEVYDKLIDHLLYTALKVNAHPLHEEFKGVSGSAEEKVEIFKRKIKEQAEESNQHQRIRESMEYAASSEAPNIDILSVLIANGASPLTSYVRDARTGNSITVQKKLQQLGGEYASLIGKSIFTITRKVHDLVFDFPMVGEEGVDLLKLVSGVPSEDGCFVESGENIRLFDNIGSEGTNEFIDLLQACMNDIGPKKVEFAVKFLEALDVVLTGRYAVLGPEVGKSMHTMLVELDSFFSPEKKEFEEAYAKLYECIKVGYSAIKTRDDKVIVDYLSEIEREAKQSKNPHLKKLYGRFFTILSEYNDLPKSIFLTRWLKYAMRTVKSYFGYEWSPAWEKILTGPGYRTDVSEWSKKKFEEIEETEIEREKSVLTARAQNAEQKAAQDAQEKEEFKQKAAQEAQAREEAEQKAERADQRAERADQRAERADRRTKVTRSFFQLLGRLDCDKELRETIAENEDAIMEAMMERMEAGNESAEQALDAIIEEMKGNNVVLDEQSAATSLNNLQITRAGASRGGGRGSSESNLS